MYYICLQIHTIMREEEESRTQCTARLTGVVSVHFRDTFSNYSGSLKRGSTEVVLLFYLCTGRLD